MRRVPLIPTIVVGLAVAAMIALGLWQLLDRRPQKLAYIARIEANPALPPIGFPAVPDEALLFRRARGYCPPPVDIALVGAGAAGFRAIAHCAGQDGMIVQLGTTRDPAFRGRWAGGLVTGYIAHAPDDAPLIAAAFRHDRRALMLVADRPLPGLAANSRPDVSAIPNNHLAYAGQWFFFAAVAAVIYALALRRRLRAQASGRGAPR